MKEGILHLFIASPMSFTSTVSLSESRVSSSPLSWLSAVEQWNSDSETVWWNSTKVMVEQWNSDGATVEQCSWNSRTMIVKQ